MESGGSSTRPLQEEKRELELGWTHCKVGTQQVDKYKRDKLVSWTWSEDAEKFSNHVDESVGQTSSLPLIFYQG